MISRKSLKKSIAASAVAGAVAFSFMFAQPIAAHASEEGEDGHIVPHEIGKLNISGGITSILQGTSGVPNNNDVTDFTYTLDLNFEAAISRHGKVIVALEAGNGTGVNDIGGTEYFLSIPNYDAYVTETAGVTTVSVSQAYYEAEYLDGFLGVTAGKLDVHSLYDENAYANDETDQFISGIFTRYPGSLFTELDSYYAPGIALTVNPSDMLEFRLIGANGSGTGFEDIFDNGYMVAHAGVMPKLLGREGNYHFHVIYDARNYTDIDTGDVTENTSFGLSADQEIMDGIGVFARYGVMDDGIDENLVKSAISAGVSLSGSLWNRENDVVGIAAGVLAINEDSSSVAANPDDEGHFEVYYKIGYGEHFTLTPDLQVVTNAGGDADNDTITVYGLRAQMNF